MAKKQKSIIVTVSETTTDGIQKVADDLAAQGMKVENVMSFSGVVSGLCTDAQLSKLRKVSGVARVDEDITFEGPAPGDSVQ